MSKIDGSCMDFIYGLLSMSPFFVKNIDANLLLLNSNTMIRKLRPHKIEFTNRVVCSTLHAILRFTLNIKESVYLIMIKISKCSLQLIMLYTIHSRQSK